MKKIILLALIFLSFMAKADIGKVTTAPSNGCVDNAILLASPPASQPGTYPAPMQLGSIYYAVGPNTPSLLSFIGSASFKSDKNESGACSIEHTINYSRSILTSPYTLKSENIVKREYGFIGGDLSKKVLIRRSEFEGSSRQEYAYAQAPSEIQFGFHVACTDSSAKIFYVPMKVTLLFQGISVKLYQCFLRYDDLCKASLQNALDNTGKPSAEATNICTDILNKKMK